MAASYDVRYPRKAPRKRPLAGAAASEWMDVPEAADALRIGVNTVRRRAAAGVLGSTTMAGRLVVSRADVVDLAGRIAAGVEARDRRTRTKGEGRLPNTWNSAGEVQTRPAGSDLVVSRERLPGDEAAEKSHVEHDVPGGQDPVATSTPWRPS